MLVKKVKVPLMIDTTDADGASSEALKRTPGQVDHQLDQPRGRRGALRARRAARAPRTAPRWSSAASTRTSSRRRRSRASASSRSPQRSHELLTEKYGVAAEDIIFDPLVFPVGTGDQNYIGSGVETIEGIRLIKEALPQRKTILGISQRLLRPARRPGARC